MAVKCDWLLAGSHPEFSPVAEKQQWHQRKDQQTLGRALVPQGVVLRLFLALTSWFSTFMTIIVKLGWNSTGKLLPMVENYCCLWVDLINGAKNTAKVIWLANQCSLSLQEIYIYILLKFPHNPPSDSFIAFPTEFSQYNFSFALFRCFFSPVLYLFERLEQEGSVTAPVMYTSSPIAFKGATLWGNQELARKKSLHNCIMFAKSDVLHA